MLLLCLSVVVAYAATGQRGKDTATAATAAKVKQRAPRPLTYGCASDLYNAKDVLHFVSRPANCKGTGKKLVKFAADYPVYACRKEHGGFVASQRARRFPYPLGIRPYGPAGLVRMVGDPSKCAPQSQPNETPVTLPQTTPRLFCAAKKGGELRWVSKVKSCDDKEFPVRLAARTVQVGSGNGEVKANADSATTDENSPTTINVLANDTGPGSSSGLAVDSVDTTGTIGTVTVNGDNTITYNPNGHFEALKAGQTATDTFTYKAKKNSVKSGSATVTVTITGVNDAPVAADDSATTGEGSTKTIAVLSNDTDADGDALHVGSLDTTGTQGTVTVNGDNTVKYDPNHKFDSLKPGDTATDTFKYKANDGTADSNSATVTVTITGANNAPVVTSSGAADPSYTEQAAPVTVDGGLTVTDSDSANLSGAKAAITAGRQATDTLAFAAPAGSGITGSYDASAGVLTLSGSSTVANYQAALRSVKFSDTSDTPGTSRTVQFTANDGTADSAPASRHITIVPVNDTPVAHDDSGTTNEDATLTKNAASGVLSNDSDPDGDTLHAVLVTPPSHDISFTLNADGSYSYTPLANYNGPDSFTYKANDGTADSTTATVSITVTAVNDAPVANNDTASTNEDTALSVAAPGVLGNDTDVEGSTLTASLATGPSHAASFTLHSNGSYDYTPTADYCGADSFTYKANDGTDDSNAATVSLTVTCVNDAPVVDLNGGSAGQDATASFTEDSPAASVAPNAELSDVDDTNLESATITLTNHPDGASELLAVNTAGTSITNGGYDSGTGVLSLTGTDTKAHYQQVLRTLQYSDSSDTPNTTSRVVNVKVNDGDADSNEPHSTVSVTAHNDAPHATDQSGLTTNEDTSLPITLSGTDPENDTLTYTHDSASAFGGTITGIGSSVTYQPAADYCGPDSFNFTVDDGNGGTDTGTVSITVSCVNDAPVTDLNGSGTAGFDTTAAFTEDSPAVSIAPNADLSDVDDPNLESATISITNHPDSPSESLGVNVGGTAIGSVYNPGTGIMTLSGHDTVAHYQQVLRTVTYSNSSDTPDTTDRVINVKVNDGDADSNEPHSTVSVTAHNDAPVATADTGSTNEDTPLSVAASGVLGNDTDPEGDPITAVLDSGPSSASSFTLNSDGSYDYTPNADFCGSDSFKYHANDGTADSSTVTVSITVNCVNDAPVTDLNGTGNAGFDTTASFTEDSPAVSVAPNADITDVDNTSLASATITLTNRPDGTAETLAVTIPGGNPITASAYTNSSGTITLTGNGATISEFQTVIRSLKYNNTSNTPDTADRNVTVKVNDGSLDSNTATSVVSVTPHNDSPKADAQSGLTTNEDTALPITLSGSDADGDPLTYTHDASSANGGTISGSTSSVNYTPAQDYCGNDTFSFTVDDGNGGTDTATVSITVTCVNDPPVVDLNGAAAGTGTNPSFAEQIAHTGGATTLAPNGTISDVDDTDLESLTVTLTNRPDGNSEYLTADTSGTHITADAYNSSTGVLLLHGHDSKANYQQVLRTVGYENDAAPPNATDRTINFVANDGDADSNTAVSTVAVVPLNAPPVLDLNSGTLGFDTTSSFTEDSGPATLAPNATATDADDPNLVSATVTLTNRPDGGAESLSANVAGTSITADAYVPATGVLFLHGSDTQANYQQVLRTVAYNNSSDTPNTADRSVTFKVNDGQDDSNTATDTVSVTATNDPPTATDQNVSTNEDTAKMITLSGTDPENDTLTFTFDSTSAQGGTITGPAPVVTYTPPADYCGNDSFNFTADDGNGGTDTGTISIAVTCVNDAPVVDLNGASAGIDNSAAFTEDQPAVTLATGAVVSDVDNANISSATVVIANPLNGSAEGLTAVTAGTSITADAYDTGTGVLFLHGSDTKAHYQQVLRSVAYNNTSNTPDPTNRDITWNVNDGSLDSATAHTTLSVTPANDAPTLDLNGAGAGANETAAYTEDQPPTTLAPNTLANDPDNTNLQSATVTLTNHPDGALESLSVDTTGTSVSAVAYNSGTGVLSLSGTDTVAHYQQVLRTISYLNTSQNANTTNRVVNFVVNDGSADSNSPTVSVTITVVNDPPVVDMNGGSAGIDSNAAFVEDSAPTNPGSGPVNLGSSATVIDVDNSSLQSMTLTLTNHPDGVNESLSVTIPGGSPITTGGYNATTGVLTLTGPATPAQFQAVIQSAKYNNVSNTPDPTDRDITIKANDGAADSTVAHTTVSVTPTNDAPVANADTFNATNSAIGNTTLNVNDTATTGAGSGDGRPPTPDPTDTSPTTDRPHKTITGNIFANDTDPDNATSEFTATPGTFATNDGGTVTIQSDGDFNFEPAPSTSCTDHSDFFNYTVNDNDPSGNASSTGSVTVAITGCVWYTNNNDAQGNSGTSEKPFDTLAQAQTASSANDTIFVYDGDDTTTGYNAGFNMKSGQTLESEGADLIIGSDNLHSADAANKASITNNNADVVSLNNGATVKSLNIDPQGTGGGICGGTACGGNATAGSTLDDVNVVDNGTKGTQPGVELNGTTGTFNFSNLTVNNGDGSSATTGDTGVKLVNAGTVNFADTGTISLRTNGAAALDASAGAGSTSLGSSTFDDITALSSGAGGVLLNGTTNASTTQFGDGTDPDLALTTVSGSPAAFSVQNAGTFNVPVGTPTSANVSATGGPAVDVVSSNSNTMSFDAVSSTNSANDGINLDFSGSPNTSTFSATSGTVGGEAGIGFDLNGGSGAMTYPATFNNGSGPLVTEITGRTGGVVSLAGSINDTNDAGGGMNIAGNTGGSAVFSGSTKQFNTGASDALTVSNPDGGTFTSVWAGGGTDIDTTSGTGVNATGVGSTPDGTIQFTISGNTIDTTTGKGLSISNVNVASAGDLWDHINGNGANAGILLNNTGTNSALTVGGTGGTCTNADTSGCSGGAILNTSGADDSSSTPVGTGVVLKDTKGVSLTRMRLANNSNYGIRGTNVNGLTLANSVINGTNGDSAVTAYKDSDARFNELTGTVSVTNTDMNGGYVSNWITNNTSGTLNATFTSFNSGATSDVVGSDNAMEMEGLGSAAVNMTMKGSTVTMARGQLLDFHADGTGGGSLTLGGTLAGEADAFSNNAPTISTGGGGVVATAGGAGNATLNIQNNTFRDAKAAGLTIIKSRDSSGGSGSVTGTISGNTIGVAGTANSGSAEGDGMEITQEGHGNMTLNVTNNAVHQINSSGFQFTAGAGIADGGQYNLNVSGNSVDNPGTNPSVTLLQSIRVDSGVTSGDTFATCVNFGANTITGSSDAANKDFRLIANDNTTIRLPGYGGGPTDGAAVAAFVASKIGSGAQGTALANSPGTFTGTGTTCP